MANSSAPVTSLGQLLRAKLDEQYAAEKQYIDSWSTPASFYLGDLEAAIRYVGSRSMADIRQITHDINDSFVVAAKPIEWGDLVNADAEPKEFSVSALMYNKVSIAQTVTSTGRRDWSVLISGEYYDIEQPVQAIAYLLATFW